MCVSRTNNEVDKVGNAKQLKTGLNEPIRSEKLKTKEVAIWYCYCTEKEQ